MPLYEAKETVAPEQFNADFLHGCKIAQFSQAYCLLHELDLNIA